MFKAIQIKNYQKHEELDLDLAQGVNVIIGPSDRGKSAVMRAIRFDVENKPDGEDFINDDFDETEILITDLQDISAVRIKGRGQSKNSYELRSKGKKPAIFKAFGKGGIPEEIEKFFNMKAINFKHQLDSPFLLSLSPGMRGEYINKIVNLEKIHESLGNIAGTLRGEKQQEERLDLSLKGTKVDITNLFWVDEAEEKIESIRLLDLDIKDKKSEADSIDEILEDIENKQKEAILLKIYAENIGPVKELLKLQEKIVLKGSNLNEIRRYTETYIDILDRKEIAQNRAVLLDNINEAIVLYKLVDQKYDQADEIENITNQIKSLQGQKIVFEKVSSLAPEIEILDIEYCELKQSHDLNDNISILARHIKNVKTDKEDKEKEFLKLDSKFHEEFNKLEVCPLCLQGIKK
jgi:exonuclease SbcC